MKETVFIPEYKLSHWLACFLPGLSGLVSLLLFVVNRKDAEFLFFVIVSIFAQLLTMYFWFKILVFRRVVFGMHNIILARFVWADIIMNYADLDYVSNEKIIFNANGANKVSIILNAMKNRYELSQIVTKLGKDGIVTLKPLSSNILRQYNKAIDYSVVLLVLIFVIYIVSRFLPIHFIGPGADATIISVIITLIFIFLYRKEL